MEALAALSARRPVAMSVMAVVIVVLGYFSWKDLPLDIFPDLQSPTILVSVSSGDRPPVEMERLYGERIERQLFTVRGLRAIEQVARSGRLITRVTFDWDTDIDLALVDVSKALAPLSADINIDDVRVRRFDPRQAPILVLGLIALDGQPDLAELRRLALRQMAPALEQLEGVAEVRITGGRTKEVQVQLDRTRLEAYGLTIADVQGRIRSTNVDINAGTIVEGDDVLMVRAISRFYELNDVAKVVVTYISGDNGSVTPIRVEDIAEVVLADADITNLVRVDGVEGVGVSIYKEAGANTVSVSRVLREALLNLSDDLPGVEARIVSDEAILVEAAIDDVEGAALLGIGLAMLVLILFLRSPGPIIVVAVAVPVSLFATVFAMRFAGHSLNLMTLGGMALGAGMLVDNAIVVVESIFRRRASGDTPLQAASKGTGFVAGAIVASTLTTCVVFLPIIFIKGMAAKLVAGIAFTVIVSLVASLLVAMLLIPALSVWLLPKNKTVDVDPGSARLESLVYALLGKSWTVVLVSGLFTAGAIYSLLQLGTELIPPSDPSQFDMRVVGPAGQRVESSAETVTTIEGILAAAAGDGLQAVLSEVGRLEDDNRIIREQQTEENTAEIHVALRPDGPSANAVIAAARPVMDTLYGIEISWETGSSTLAAAMGSSGPPVLVEIMGNSLDDLRVAAERVRQQLAASPGLWNVQSSFEGAPPELRLRLKRSRADALGVDLNSVGAVLEASLDGINASTLTMGDEERDVQILLPKISTEDLLNLPFQTAAGVRLTLGDVVEIEETQGAREIFRRDQRRIAQVTANIEAELSAPQARQNVLDLLAAIELPAGLSASLAGEELERKQTFDELKWAGLLAVLLVLMVLAGSFESLLHPFTILASIPLSLIGVAIILVPMGQPIGIMSMLGFIVLVGIAVNDAILFAQYARRLIQEGQERRRALARAASLRFRPIIMTTATTVLALLPLAIGTGDAAQMRGPLALTVIGGIIASTLTSLLVIPCLYFILDKFSFSSGSTPNCPPNSPLNSTLNFPPSNSSQLAGQDHV